MDILIILIIALSLSLDAFSLSLSYGLANISNKNILKESICVGIFHFIMPLIGLYFGKLILSYIEINPKYLLALIFLLIVIGIIKTFNETEEEIDLTLTGVILFALAVSIDSFTIGISLNVLTDKVFLGAIIFGIASFIFTFLGFKLGKYISIKVGKISKLMSAIILLSFGFYFLCK